MPVWAGTFAPVVPHFLSQRQVNTAQGRVLVPSGSPGCCSLFINPSLFYGAAGEVAQPCWGAWGPQSSALVPLCWCHHIHSAPALGCGSRARQSLLHPVNLCKSFGVEMCHGHIQCLVSCWGHCLWPRAPQEGRECSMPEMHPEQAVPEQDIPCTGILYII